MDVLGSEERGERWGEGTILRNWNIRSGALMRHARKVAPHLDPLPRGERRKKRRACTNHAPLTQVTPVSPSLGERNKSGAFSVKK
jgi:hypothetical protein